MGYSGPTPELFTSMLEAERSPSRCGRFPPVNEPSVYIGYSASSPAAKMEAVKY
jgi:hypothetical protein